MLLSLPTKHCCNRRHKKIGRCTTRGCLVMTRGRIWNFFSKKLIFNFFVIFLRKKIFAHFSRKINFSVIFSWKINFSVYFFMENQFLSRFFGLWLAGPAQKIFPKSLAWPRKKWPGPSRRQADSNQLSQPSYNMRRNVRSSQYVQIRSTYNLSHSTTTDPKE